MINKILFLFFLLNSSLFGQYAIIEDDSINVAYGDFKIKYHLSNMDSNGIIGEFQTKDSLLLETILVIDSLVKFRWNLDVINKHYSIKDLENRWEEHYISNNDSLFQLYSRVKRFEGKQPKFTFRDKKKANGLPEFCLISKSETFRDKGYNMNLTDTLISIKFIYYEDMEEYSTPHP